MTCILPAAAAAQDTQAPIITHAPCRWYSIGAPTTIHVTIDDESALYDPKIMLEQEGQWLRIPLEPDPGGGYRAVAPPHTGGPLRYFIEVMDENGNGPARFGSAERPVELLPSQTPGACMDAQPITAQPTTTPGQGCESASPPVYCSAAFWGITGAVVAAVGAGVVIYFSTRDSGPGGGDNGTVTLDITGPSPTGQTLRAVRR